MYKNREDVIHTGKLLHFRQIDKDLDLPPGTAKKLLNKVADWYDLEPEIEEENIARYKFKEDYLSQHNQPLKTDR